MTCQAFQGFQGHAQKVGDFQGSAIAWDAFQGHAVKADVFEGRIDDCRTIVTAEVEDAILLQENGDYWLLEDGSYWLQEQAD